MLRDFTILWLPFVGDVGKYTLFITELSDVFPWIEVLLTQLLFVEGPRSLLPA